jgi:hypothetical protein
MLPRRSDHGEWNTNHRTQKSTTMENQISGDDGCWSNHHGERPPTAAASQLAAAWPAHRSSEGTLMRCQTRKETTMSTFFFRG